MQPNTPRDIAIFGILGLLGATFGTLSYYYQNEPFVQPALTVAPSAHHLPKLTLDAHAIGARAAIVYDPKTGDILFEKNSEAQLPLASLTKLATARAVLSAADTNQIIIIKSADLKPEGDSGLRAGDVWRLGDLIAFGLTTSSNDAMAAAAASLSPTATVKRMNEEAKNTGMPQSYFLNPTGLDVSPSTSGGYGSAKDVAHLVEDMLHRYPSIFEATTQEPKLSGTSGKGAEPTAQPLWSIPGLIAAKTGYTDLAGGNLAAAVDLGLNEPVIVVVLGSTHEGRFDDIRTLVDAARAAATQ